MAAPEPHGSTEARRVSVHEALFLAFLASVPFARVVVVRAGGMPVVLADVIFLVAFTSWALAVLRGSARLRRSHFYFPLAAYAIALIASAVGSDTPQRSLFKAASVFYLLGIAVLTYNVASSRERFARAAGATLVTTAVTVAASSVGVVLFFLGLRARDVNLVLWGYGSLPPGNYPRLQGFFANGNMLCNFLILASMLALWARSAGRLSVRAFLALAAGICVTAAFTISPGLGGLALAVGLWWHLRQPRSKLGIVALAGGVLAAVGFVALAAVELSRGALRPSVRLRVWQGSFRTFVENPLLGRGVGTETTVVEYVNLAGLKERLTEAHNIWLSVAAQEGILGLLGFGSIVVWLLWRWRRATPTDATNAAARTALGCALVGAILMQGLTGALEDARHVWVLFGLMAAAVDGWRADRDAVVPRR